MSSQECQICTERLNKTFRAPIKCSKCEFECCKTCFKRYISDTDSIHMLKCMNCNIEFDRSSLYDRVGATFMATVFRDIRQTQLYEIEKGYFPATQSIIEEELKVVHLIEDSETLDAKYEDLRVDRTAKLTNFRYSEEATRVRDAIDKYESIKNEVEILDEQLRDERELIQSKINSIRGKNGSSTTYTYVMQCPNIDCKGLLSNESTNKVGHFVCAICNTVVCRSCHMMVSETEHICDPDVILSIEFLEKSTKPCPSCKVPIHKISGCNQMFCTGCHASFDWRTLRLNQGVIHNPHHAQWLRTQQNRPRELGDIPCGRELDIHIAINCCDDFRDIIPSNGDTELNKMCDYLFDTLRFAIHHNHESIVSLGRNRYGHHTNQSLRINLLRNRISEDVFKYEIQKRDKANSKRAELLQIVMTYRDAITDIVWPFIEDGLDKSLKDWTNMIGEVKALESYINDCFVKISKVYGSTVYTILDDRNIR